jgi:hypothetical protein
VIRDCFDLNRKKYKMSCQAPVAHTYNPSYSRGRDQEDHSSKPAQANSSKILSRKNPLHKKGWWSGPEFKPQYHKKKKKKKKKKKNKNLNI